MNFEKEYLQGLELEFTPLEFETKSICVVSFKNCDIRIYSVGV